MNILIDIIPASARRYVYAAYALIGLVLGALQVYGNDVSAILGVYAFIGAALGITAYANTGTPPTVYVSDVTGERMTRVTLPDGTEQHFIAP